jgi:hypothetical protein
MKPPRGLPHPTPPLPPPPTPLGLGVGGRWLGPQTPITRPPIRSPRPTPGRVTAPHIREIPPAKSRTILPARLTRLPLPPRSRTRRTPRSTTCWGMDDHSPALAAPSRRGTALAPPAPCRHAPRVRRSDRLLGGPNLPHRQLARLPGALPICLGRCASRGRLLLAATRPPRPATPSVIHWVLFGTVRFGAPRQGGISEPTSSGERRCLGLAWIPSGYRLTTWRRPPGFDPLPTFPVRCQFSLHSHRLYDAARTRGRPSPEIS